MVQLSDTRCSCIAILWVGPVSFAAITLCVASQRMLILVIYRYRLSPETFGYTLVKFASLLILLLDHVSCIHRDFQYTISTSILGYWELDIWKCNKQHCHSKKRSFRRHYCDSKRMGCHFLRYMVFSKTNREGDDYCVLQRLSVRLWGYWQHCHGAYDLCPEYRRRTVSRWHRELSGLQWRTYRHDVLELRLWGMEVPYSVHRRYQVQGLDLQQHRPSIWMILGVVLVCGSVCWLTAMSFSNTYWNKRSWSRLCSVMKLFT